MDSVINICDKAKQASYELAKLSCIQKNDILKVIADSLIKNKEYIISENAKDIKVAEKDGKPKSFIDRLALNSSRIDGMANGILQLIDLADPVDVVERDYVADNSLNIKKIRVPFGVIAIIYEARPNVTADAIGLCIKSGNTVVLRGSKDAILSNIAIVNCIKKALKFGGFNQEFVQLIEDTSRDSAMALMRAKGYVDLLIPRGNASLINSVVENAIVPVIETGTGNCHIYIHKDADLEMARRITFNAKTHRVSVCNSCESLLIDEEIADKFLPIILKDLEEKSVKIYGCDKTCKLYKNAKPATEDDFYKEYNDYIISVKVVKNIDEAVKHINKYSTQHSEAIITKNNDVADLFTKSIDSAAVYVNASTRFTDGFEFGFGAEMGISTQKLHARGPVGLYELTSYKYIIKGNGNIRQ